MKLTNILLGGAALLLASACTHHPSVTSSASFPSQEAGYEQGVSACYAGVIGNQLIMAGGANFADVPAAEGGAKCFYQGIYAACLDSDSLVWRQVGKLPKAAAYGVALQSADSLIFVGGCNAKGTITRVYSMHLCGDSAMIRRLKSLPFAIDNMAGCVAGSIAYLAGGNVGGKPSNKIFALDLASPSAEWRLVGRMPEPRVQPVCAAAESEIYIWGGFTPASDQFEAETHTDGFVLDMPHNTLNRTDSPKFSNEPVTLSGGCAAYLGNSKIVCMGGVNKDIFTDAISGKYSLIAKDEYLKQPAEWYQFNRLLFIYDTDEQTWTCLGEYPDLARAGATLVCSGDGSAYLIGGEVKPGIRTPKITKVTIK